VQKILICISNNSVKPNSQILKEVVKSRINSNDFEYFFSISRNKKSLIDIALAFKKWGFYDIWLYGMNELLILDKLKECGRLLSAIKLEVPVIFLICF